MRESLRWVGQGMLLVLVGALAARAGPAGPPGESVSASLQSAPLDGVAAVVSKTDGAAAKAQILGAGILAPSVHIQFGPVVKEYGLKIAGQKVSIIATDSGFAVKGDTGQIELHQNGMGLASIALPITSAQKYYLAFPFVSNAPVGPKLMMVRSGGTVQCQIDGQNVMFYDDNLDGRYTMADDTFRVGGTDGPIDVFAPVSEFFSTGRSIYRIESLAEDGTTLKYSPYQGAAGKLAVACDAADWGVMAALTNSDGKMNLVSRGAASTPDAVAAIPGQYKLLYGGVFSKKTGALFALLAPGSLPVVEVAADQTQTLQLGGALHLEFTVNKQTPGNITIQPSSYRVKGKAGEEYTAFTFDKSKPAEVFISRGDTKVSLGKIGFS